MIDGIIESAKDLKMLDFLKQINHIKQYAKTKIKFIIKYARKYLLFIHPKQVFGILMNINVKQLKRPICSAISTNLLCQIFTKPSLHLMAKTILGIRIIIAIIRP